MVMPIAISRQRLLLGLLAAPTLILPEREATAWGVHGSTAGTIALIDFTNNPVFQRTAGQTTGPVYVSGTYTGPNPNPQGQLRKISDNSVVVAWTNLTNLTQGSGFFQGSIPGAPQGVDMKAEVRRGDNNSVSSAGTGTVRVGACCLMYGQSNMSVLSTQTNGSPPSAASGTSCFQGNKGSSSAWVAVPAANGIRQLLNNLNSLLGIAVAAIDLSVVGADIGFLSGSNWANVVNNLNAMNVNGDFELLFFNQGENNAQSVPPNQFENEWVGDLQLIQSQALSQTGRSSAQLPIIVSSLATLKSPNTPSGGPWWAETQQYIYDAGTQAPNITYSHTDIFAALGADGLHMTGADCDKVGQMFAQTAGVIAGATSNYPHWYITSATLTDATHTTVGLTHSMGTDFTPTSGITGFEVSGDGGATWLTPSAAVRTNATTITLTHSSLQTSQRLVRYAYGTQPNVSSPIIDNSSIGVPLNYTPYWITCASPSIPVPTFRPPGTKTVFNNSTHICSSVSNLATGDGSVAQTVFLAVMQANTPTGVTLTPYPGGVINPGSAGSGIAMTLAASVSGGCSIWTCQIATGVESCSIAAQYSGVVAASVFDLWTVPTSLLNSATPVASAGKTMTPGDTTDSVTLQTNANGFVIVCAFQEDGAAVFSGTENYARGHHVGLGKAVSAYSAVNASNASSVVTITMASGASSNDNMLAASFR
ncbi:MAG TPA: hypothetical protein VLJ17_24805 [Xanthobacteraceae bacterium]|nr:hypothetical protein [Xanthobacteraceae bacterium]